jgi:hypothetical protein
VCDTLKTKQFLETNNLVILRKDGPRHGMTTTYTFGL